MRLMIEKSGSQTFALLSLIEADKVLRDTPVVLHMGIKLLPEIKEEWLRRLRSGDYTQATRTLRAESVVGGDVAYCCFGVLGEILCERGVTQRKTDRDGTSYLTGQAGEVQNTAMLTANAWQFVVTPQSRTQIPIALAELNDSGATFDQIADVIEIFL